MSGLSGSLLSGHSSPMIGRCFVLSSLDRIGKNELGRRIIHEAVAELGLLGTFNSSASLMETVVGSWYKSVLRACTRCYRVLLDWMAATGNKLITLAFSPFITLTSRTPFSCSSKASC